MYLNANSYDAISLFPIRLQCLNLMPEIKAIKVINCGTKVAYLEKISCCVSNVPK